MSVVQRSADADALIMHLTRIASELIKLLQDANLTADADEVKADSETAVAELEKRTPNKSVIAAKTGAMLVKVMQNADLLGRAADGVLKATPIFHDLHQFAGAVFNWIAALT